MPTPNIIKMPTREVRILMRHARLRIAGIRIDRSLPRPARFRRRDDAAVAFHTEGLDDRSVVYSFGVGADIRWDREVIESFGAVVHGFDPSPATVAWARTAALPSKFIFHPVGIAAHDGMLRLYPPPTTRTPHYSCINRSRAPEDQAVDVPVKRLATFARELGHDRVDLLKLDVDGSEYAVLPDILDSGIPIRQILVEFHHDFRTLRFAHTQQAVDQLRSRGYRIFDISHRAREFCFLKAD
jgi:FkbM family methyltransferase